MVMVTADPFSDSFNFDQQRTTSTRETSLIRRAFPSVFAGCQIRQTIKKTEKMVTRPFFEVDE